MGIGKQACHLFLMNVLSEVKNLVKEERTATAGEALGVTALQMMAVVLSDRRDNPGWVSCFDSIFLLNRFIHQ